MYKIKLAYNKLCVYRYKKRIYPIFFSIYDLMTFFSAPKLNQSTKIIQKLKQID